MGLKQTFVVELEPFEGQIQSARTSNGAYYLDFAQGRGGDSFTVYVPKTLVNGFSFGPDDMVRVTPRLMKGKYGLQVEAVAIMPMSPAGGK